MGGLPRAYKGNACGQAIQPDHRHTTAQRPLLGGCGAVRGADSGQQEVPGGGPGSSRGPASTSGRGAPSSSAAPSSSYGGGRGGDIRSERERAARKAARVEDKEAAAARNTQGCCYGCGAALQTEVPPGPGYVAPDKYAAKKLRRQLDKVLCLRCSDLSNGAMIPAVQDFTQKLSVRQGAAAAARAAFASAAAARAPAAKGAQASADAAAPTALPLSSDDAPELLGKVLVTPEQLRARLTPLALRSAVVLLLVDLLDASGTLMARVRDMVGRNPIVLVGTKMDLLPEGCRPRELAEWLSSAAAAKKLNLVSLHLVSSHTGEGMSAVVSRMCRERKSRDVYVVGAANVGKSAFVRAVLKELARTEPAAIGTGKYLPVESAMPGTTLGLIPLRAFSEGGVLYDTPGVHLHHRIPHMLSPPELKLFHPRRRLSAVVPTLPLEFSEEPEDAAPDDADSRSSAAMGPASDGDEGPARSGRNGLKIVQHAPRDQHGAPMSGLEAGFGPRGPAARPGSAASNAAAPLRAAAGVRSGPGQAARAAVRATYMWSDLVRVDVLAGPPSTALVFYGPASMRVVGLPYIPAEQRLLVDYQGGGDEEGGEGQAGARSRVLVCTESVALRGGLQAHELLVRASGVGGGCAVADIAVSGLSGWVAVWAPGAKQDVRLRVWAPRGVEVMLRAPLPCPPPPALQRAWRRSSGKSEEEEGEEGSEDVTPAALDEWSRALSLGSRDPTSDPEWWESMAALKDADLYGMAGLRGRGRRAGTGGVAVGATAGGSDGSDADDMEQGGEDDGEEGGEAVMVSARVEDILRRPRLDVLAQMDLDECAEGAEEAGADEGEGEGEGAGGGWGAEEEAGGRGGGGEGGSKGGGAGGGMDGPEADGRWDLLDSGPPTRGPAAGQAAVLKGRQPPAGVSRQSRRKGAGVASVSREASAAGAEAAEQSDDEEWGEAEVLELPRATARQLGGGRRRLGLRRAVTRRPEGSE